MDAAGFERTYRIVTVLPNPATGDYVFSQELARTVTEATVTVRTTKVSSSNPMP